MRSENQTNPYGETGSAHYVRLLAKAGFNNYADECRRDYGSRFDVYLDALVASGGQGHVFEAELVTGLLREAKQKRVLAKIIQKKGTAAERHVLSRRFVKESSVPTSLREHCRSVQSLKGLESHIPEVTYYSELSSEMGEFYYILFTHQEGITLNELLKKNAPLSPENVARVFLPVAEVLQVMHSHNYIHRDIKPENIFVTKDGRSQPIDFGTVKHLSEYEQIILGKQVGTPIFMAPEALLAPRSPLDAKTDVYGLAMSMYKALTGKDPYTDFSELQGQGSTSLDGQTIAARLREIYDSGRLPTPMYVLRPELSDHRSGKILTGLVDTGALIDPRSRVPIGDIVEGLVEVLPPVERAAYHAGIRPVYTVGEIAPLVRNTYVPQAQKPTEALF